MSAATSLATRLAEAVGSQRVVAAPQELVTYAVDGLSPAVIVRPVSATEVVEVVKFAIAERLKVVPTGARSKCEIGMAPTRYDIAVDMTGLHEIANYDAGDMTLSIDAGTPLRELEGFLRQNGQFLPLAVPCFESTTAGGTIASGIDSVLRQQYGTARDFLIGAEFVDGKGQLCKSGGRVVKNVTGYDLHKLLIGSLGTLGVITRLNFRTFPVPATSGGHVATFRKSTAAVEYRKMLEKAGVPLTNFEIISPEVIKIMRAILQQQVQGSIAALSEDGLWYVYSSFEGTEKVGKRIAGELDKFARGAGSRNLQLLETGTDELIGGMLREAFEWLRCAAQETVLYRLAICGDAADVADQLTRAAASIEIRSASLVRSGRIIYFVMFGQSEEEILEPAESIHAQALSIARELGGYVTLLHGPLKVKLRIAEEHGRGMNQGLQQRVKKAFDPSDIFAPGRVVGGI